MFDLVNIFGFGAILFTILSFIPQIWKSWQSKSVNDISWLMIVIHLLGNICWVSYGFMKLDPVILITDSAVLIVIFVLLLLKIKYNK